MSRVAEDSNRRLLRARDAMDRTYAQPLDIPSLARIAYVSEAHFIRIFHATFGETPHRYLQRREANAAAGTAEPALEAFRWQIEELKVSLFAQELRTPQPVSYKRLEKAWTDLSRG